MGSWEEQEENVRERREGVNFSRSWLEWKLRIKEIVASSRIFVKRGGIAITLSKEDKLVIVVVVTMYDEYQTSSAGKRILCPRTRICCEQIPLRLDMVV